jgi:type II secretory pathway pseudopilin PulG
MNFASKVTTQRRSAFSLVELLIAMVVTLIVLGAMMALFQYGSVEMKKGRAAVDMTTKLQSVESQLRSDLSQITVEIKPHHRLPSIPKGYFEIVEGPMRDYVSSSYEVSPVHNGDTAYLGDIDDFIAFTIKSPDKPFWQNGIASQFAEVAWYVSGRKIHRKIRLVSAGSENSLTELGYRGKRIGHLNGSYPHTSPLNFSDLSKEDFGAEVLLSNVVAFDIQVFDPDARQYLVRETISREIIGVADPMDVGAVKGIAGGSFDDVSRGAFVDLGSSRIGIPGEKPIFANPPHPRYGNQAVYDTGTSLYDHNEVDDTGSNGVDDDAIFGGEQNGIVDDASEKESIAPYNERIRGIRIRIRVIDLDTKQVRQLSITQSFVPE